VFFDIHNISTSFSILLEVTASDFLSQNSVSLEVEPFHVSLGDAEGTGIK